MKSIRILGLAALIASGAGSVSVAEVGIGGWMETPLVVGWVGGSDSVGAAILHTEDAGRTWTAQIDPAEWPGYEVTDISAVDDQTAWAALGGGSDQGAILHTQDGGQQWIEQELPDQVADVVKQIKGLSRLEAWAATLGGSALHTTDGGDSWRVVASTVEQAQINRMDVIGCLNPKALASPSEPALMSNANIWAVDELGGEYGMIHSLYNGELWRREQVPDYPNGMHMVSAFSPRIVWAATRIDPTLFRTMDGGESWQAVASAGGPNDFDDMCAVGSDTVWAVQNQNTAGTIFRVRAYDDQEPQVDGFDPANGYLYEGMTCVDAQTALVVGFRVLGDASEPRGIIVSTTDGGQSWRRHSAPLADVSLWKTSFVGARR